MILEVYAGVNSVNVISQYLSAKVPFSYIDLVKINSNNVKELNLKLFWLKIQCFSIFDLNQ